MRCKRILGLLLTAVLAVGCLSGCGDKDKEKEPTGGNQQEEVNNGAGDKTITVSMMAGEGVETGWKAVADAYMKLHDDVKVVVDLKPQDGYDQWVQNVFNTSDTTSVDIVNINLAGPSANDRYIDFGDYMENDSAYSDGAWKEQFEYGKQTVLPNGSMQMLNLDSVQVMWLYNMDIFEEVGVEPPTTWSELEAACEKILAAGYQPIAMPGTYDSFASQTMGWLSQVYTDQTTRSTLNLIRSQEGDYTYDPDIDGKFVYDAADPYNDDYTNVTKNELRFFNAVLSGEYTLETPGMKNVWTNLAEVFPKYAGGDAMFGTTYAGAKTLFYQGKAAMIVDGGWFITAFANDMKALESGQEITGDDGSAITDAKTFELGSFNMPSMEGEGIEAKARTIEVATGCIGCVKKNQAHDDLVMDFLMYFSSAEGMSVYVDAALADGFSPSGPSLVYGVKYPENVQNAFERLTMIGNCQKAYGSTLSRGIYDLPESMRVYYDNSYKYLSGAIDVDEYLKLSQQNIMDNLEAAMASSKIGMGDLKNPANEPTGE